MYSPDKVRKRETWPFSKIWYGALSQNEENHNNVTKNHAFSGYINMSNFSTHMPLSEIGLLLYSIKIDLKLWKSTMEKIDSYLKSQVYNHAEFQEITSCVPKIIIGNGSMDRKMYLNE